MVLINQSRFIGLRRSSLAFTLLELIMVMAMLTVVIALAAPSLSGFFRARTLDSEARRVLSMIRLGQSRAASEGVPMVLWLDPDQRRYGLREAEGYSERDLNALEFRLHPDLNLELERPPESAQYQLSTLERTSSNLGMIRFLPDGTFSEISLPSITVVRTNAEALVITQTLNRLSYEIQQETNNFRRGGR
jgi:Tfp pilus assembly protein FimT